MTIDPGPIDRTVLTEQVKHRSELLWNPGGGDPPGTLDCRTRHEELRLRVPMVDDRVLTIVRLLGLEGLYLVPSIQLDHALITAFVERWRPETHTFHLPHGEMTITLQDMEVIMGLPIEGEAMVGPSKKTWTTVCDEMLGIQIPNGDQNVLKGQRILVSALVARIRKPLPPNANEIQVHQYARCYILALLGDMVFLDKSGDRVHLMWLEFMQNLHNPRKYSWGSAALSWLYRQLCNASEKKAKQIGGPLILVQLWIFVRFPHMSPQMVPQPEGVHGPPLPPIPFAMKFAGAMCRKNTPTHVLSAYRNQIATTRPDQIKWEPYGNDLSHLPPNFCTEGSNVWRSTVPLICFWIVEFHLPDRVLRQFGLKQEQPRDANTNRNLHKIDARGKVEKNWSVEHAVHIQRWNDRGLYICHALRMEEVMSRHHPYMVWYRRITRLYIDRASAKMEILLATQLAVLNWFNKESYEYKFIKKALEDVDEVDRINVPANDEAANQTEIPDVGPSTSSVAPVTCHQPAPTPPLATETPVPPVSTPQATTGPPMPPIPPIDTGSPSRFTHAEFEFSPPTTTVDHNSPMAPSYSSPQTVIPTPSLQTPHIEPMSTSPSHTQSPPTSSTLIHVPQATHPHDNDVEQGQRDQAEQPQDANAHAAPKRKSTRAIQPRRCGTGSHLVADHVPAKQDHRRNQKRSKRGDGAA
nr:serine/threonine-protein phosphatase 7 long form homolog [Quercus suber]